MRPELESADEYERVAEIHRRRLSSTLDELSASLTPGRVLDEVLSYTRAGGGDFLMGLGKAASANPVPTLLIGVGAAMFLSGRGRLAPTAERAPHDETTPGEKTIADEPSRARSAGSAAKEGLAAARSGVAEAASGLRSGVSSAGEAVSQAGARVGEAASGAAATVSDYAASAREGLADRGRKAYDRGSTFVQDHPLVVAAIGVGIGAALAAWLPRTRTEDSLLGEASDSLKGAIGEVAGKQYRDVKAAAESVASEAKASAARHGFSAEGAAQTVRTMADKVVPPAAKVPGNGPAGE